MAIKIVCFEFTKLIFLLCKLFINYQYIVKLAIHQIYEEFSPYNIKLPVPTYTNNFPLRGFTWYWVSSKIRSIIIIMAPHLRIVFPPSNPCMAMCAVRLWPWKYFFAKFWALLASAADGCNYAKWPVGLSAFPPGDADEGKKINLQWRFWQKRLEEWCVAVSVIEDVEFWMKI